MQVAREAISFIMFNFFRRKSPEQLRLERINAYIDGELTPAKRATFEQAMERDATLQAEVDALRDLDALLAELPQVDVPRNFTISAPRPVPARFPRQFAPTLAGVTMIVLLCGVIFSLLQEGFFGAPEQVIVTQIVEKIKEVEVQGETVVEEVVVTQIVELEVQAETVVEEVIVTQIMEVAVEAETVVTSQRLHLPRFLRRRNLWYEYSVISTKFQSELDNDKTIPRLYQAQVPFLGDFGSEVLDIEGNSIVLDIIPAYWRDGEKLDSADIAFTYQTCLALQLYATDNSTNGWTTACPPDLLLNVTPLTQASVQFTFSTPLTSEQFRREIAQAPIMAKHIWEPVVAEALAFEDVAQGRNFLLSDTP